MKKLTIHIEEALLWKLVQFAGVGEGKPATEDIEQGSDDLQKYVLIYSIVGVSCNRISNFLYFECVNFDLPCSFHAVCFYY